MLLLVAQDVADPKVVERMKESMGALAATSSRPSALFPICALNGYDAIHAEQTIRKELTGGTVLLQGRSGQGREMVGRAAARGLRRMTMTPPRLANRSPSTTACW